MVLLLFSIRCDEAFDKRSLMECEHFHRLIEYFDAFVEKLILNRFVQIVACKIEQFFQISRKKPDFNKLLIS